MSTQIKLAVVAALSAAFAVGCASTQPEKKQVVPTTKTVNIQLVSAEGIGQNIGQLRLTDTANGLSIETNLTALPPGPHGFHVHEKGSCAPAEKDGKMGAALAAGGHYNPHQLPNHGTPLTGHMGDLPLLVVDTNGTNKTTVLAPRLKLADVQGRAVMIHAGGDNYSDDPKPLGGGGDRIACGVI